MKLLRTPRLLRERNPIQRPPRVVKEARTLLPRVAKSLLVSTMSLLPLGPFLPEALLL